MRNVVLVVFGLVTAAGIGLAVASWWGGPETDRDSDLVFEEAVPANFPLAPLPETEGSLLAATTREMAAMTTITVQYALEDDVDEDTILDRYAKLMASQGGRRPVRTPGQVRADRPRGMMAARIVTNEGRRVLTLVAVARP